MRVLKLNVRGADVTDWQQCMENHGFNPGSIDSIFGSQTKAATEAFQQEAGLQVDGIVGNITQEAAREILDCKLPDRRELISSFTERIAIPDTINQGVSFARQSTMLNILGVPCTKTDHCMPITNARLRNLMVTRNVGPFRVRGLKPFVDLLERVFSAVKEESPELHEQLGTAGALCCRKVRGGQNFSNHSWGTAIDIKIGGQLDRVGDGRAQKGLVMLEPFFNKEKCFWGAGFSREDSMHFEASNQLIKQWNSSGII